MDSRHLHKYRTGFSNPYIKNQQQQQYSHQKYVNVSHILILVFFIIIVLTIIILCIVQLLKYCNKENAKKKLQLQRFPAESSNDATTDVRNRANYINNNNNIINNNNSNIEQDLQKPFLIHLTETILYPREQIKNVYTNIKSYLFKQNVSQAGPTVQINEQRLLTQRSLLSDIQITRRRILNRSEIINNNSNSNNNNEDNSISDEQLISKKPIISLEEIDEDKKTKCTICFDSMDVNNNELIFCKYGCGNFFHHTCYQKCVAVNTAPRSVLDVARESVNDINSNNRMKNPKACFICKKNIPLVVVEIGKIHELCKQFPQ